jgi:hypothetical protein
MQAAYDIAVRDLHAKSAALIFQRRVLLLWTIYALFWGTAVVVLRSVGGMGRGPLAWGAVGLLIMLAPAAVAAIRGRPSVETVRVLLDRHSRAGGLYMAGAEVDTTDWRERMPPPVMLRIALSGRPAWIWTCVAAAYVAAAFLVPQRVVTGGGPQTLQIAHEVARYQEQVQVLREEKIIHEPEAREWRDQLAQVQAKADGADPARTWEVLDHMQESLAKAANDAAQKALRQAHDLDRLAALGRALAQKGEPLDAGVRASAMADLAGDLTKAMEEDQNFKDGMSKDLSDALDNGQAGAAQLQTLAKLLEGERARLGQQMMRLSEMHLTDADLAKLAGEPCDAQAILDGLRALGADGDPADVEDAIEHGLPGKGGLTRGPGSSAIAGTGETKDQGDKFRPEALNPAGLQALQQSKIIGVSAGAPQVTPGANPAQSGALRDAAAGGGGAITQTILPRHEGTVQRYFDRDNP